MVSFFGLKIGGDKKKKHEKQAQEQQQWKRGDRNVLGENQYFGQHMSKPVAAAGVDTFPSRPQTSHSSRSNRVSRFFARPYAANNGASSSMVDLSAPSRSLHERKQSATSMRHGGSTFEIKHAWTDGSIPPRPGTAGGLGNAQKKTWVNPLDGQFGKETSPKSPLAQFEFKTVSPNGASPVERNGNAQADEPPDGYPSPPASIRSVNGELSVAKSRSTNPSALRQVASANPVGTGPSALPSPANSSDRTSEDRQAPIWTGPVIQNVSAKRDTMNSVTFGAPRRQSLSMDIEQAEKSILAEFSLSGDGPDTTAGTSPPRRQQPDRSEFAAFNFSDDRPSTAGGTSPPQKYRPEAADYSGFTFSDDDRPRTSAGPSRLQEADRPAPLNIHKEPQRKDFQHAGPISPSLHKPIQPGPGSGWGMSDNTRPRGDSAETRPRGDRILPVNGPSILRLPPRLQPQPQVQVQVQPQVQPQAQEPESPAGFFGSTGPRASPIEGGVPRFDSRFPSRQSIRPPDDPERGFDPRLRVAPRTKPRSPSPLTDLQPKSRSPELRGPQVQPQPQPQSQPQPQPKPQTVPAVEPRSPVEDMFQEDRGELDLSFNFPGQPTPISPSQQSSRFASPRTPKVDQDANWPLVSSPPTQPLPELPKPGFSADSRPYTPPLRMNIPRTEPPLEPPPRAPGRGISPMRAKKVPPPLPLQKARSDAALDAGLRTPTGVADNFGTAFI